MLGKPQPSALFNLPRNLARQAGPMNILPLYRLFLGEFSGGPFSRDAYAIKFSGHEAIDGRQSLRLTWEHAASPFLATLGLTNHANLQARIPVTAWIEKSSGHVLQIRMDFSSWAAALVDESPDIPVTSLVFTETHKNIKTSRTPDVEDAFRYKPSRNDRAVAQFDLPPVNWAALASTKRRFERLIPPRLPSATPNMIDLSEYYNAAMSQPWHPQSPGNCLDSLPAGLLQFSGTAFDVRGVVQLTGRKLQEAGGQYPNKVTGIPVRQSCRQLHFLQATGWSAAEGTRVGSYTVHYAGGREEQIPIVYGEEVRDWNTGGDRSNGIKHGVVVWSATNKAGFLIRLFMNTWNNPAPDTEILSIDYLSAGSDAAPFLLAITADPGEGVNQ
jgi:hypothetical protein